MDQLEQKLGVVDSKLQKLTHIQVLHLLEQCGWDLDLHVVRLLWQEWHVMRKMVEVGKATEADPAEVFGRFVGLPQSLFEKTLYMLVHGHSQ